MSGLFNCPYCDHNSSDGWYHMKACHPEKIKEYNEMIDKEEVFEPVVKNIIAHMPVGTGTYIITRRLEFDAGHRVYMHESKCSNIHGHRYVVELSCTGKLDSLGRVIDFSVIKSLCGSWIDENLDHGMILYMDDPLIKIWEGFGQNPDIGWQKYFIMVKNPTAENIAEMLYSKFEQLLEEHDIKIVEVTVHETPNCKAVFR